MTVIAPGAEWRYFDQGVDLGTSWRDLGFVDSSWASGNGLFGYGNGNETTVVSFGPDAINKYPTTYFRKTFDITSPSSVDTLSLSLLYDDGVVAYLNGSEIARTNMPLTSTYTSFATSSIGGAAETNYNLSTVTNLLVAGTNVLAVEVHQSSPSSSDMSFDLGVSGLELTTIPEPGSAALLFVGMSPLLASRRRR